MPRFRRGPHLQILPVTLESEAELKALSSGDQAGSFGDLTQSEPESSGNLTQ